MIPVTAIAVAPISTLDALVEDDDWSRIAMGPDGRSLFLARPAPQPNSVWVRMEYEDVADQRSWLSSRQLVELDCERWQWRTLEFTAFSQNNLEGEERIFESSDRWLPAPQGTFAHTYVAYGCDALPLDY